MIGQIPSDSRRSTWVERGHSRRLGRKECDSGGWVWTADGFVPPVLVQRDDSCENLVLEGSHDVRTLLWCIERAVFVVVVSKAVHPAHYRAALDETAFMLRQICFVMSNNHLF